MSFVDRVFANGFVVYAVTRGADDEFLVEVHDRDDCDDGHGACDAQWGKTIEEAHGKLASRFPCLRGER